MRVERLSKLRQVELVGVDADRLRELAQARRVEHRLAPGEPLHVAELRQHRAERVGQRQQQKQRGAEQRRREAESPQHGRAEQAERDRRQLREGDDVDLRQYCRPDPHQHLVQPVAAAQDARERPEGKRREGGEHVVTPEPARVEHAPGAHRQEQRREQPDAPAERFAREGVGGGDAEDVEERDRPFRGERRRARQQAKHRQPDLRRPVVDAQRRDHADRGDVVGGQRLLRQSQHNRVVAPILRPLEPEQAQERAS